MATTWTMAIDWDRNGDFTDTYDDVTSRVVSATWFLGMRQPYGEAADDSMLDLVLSNADRRFSPEYSGGPLHGKLVPFRPVRIQSNDGSTTRTHWVGWVESIQPAVNRYGRRVTQVVATGAMQFLKAAETRLPLQENRRTDEIIADLIKEVVMPPALSRAWVLGRVGSSELGQTTYLATTTAYSALDAGKVRLAIAADNWVQRGGSTDAEQDTFNVYRAIRDVAATEQGSATLTLDVRASGAALEIANGGAQDAVLATCTVQGRKITDFGRMEARQFDGASMALYGRRVLNLNLPSVDRFDDAESIARFELQRRSSPRGTVQALTVQSHGTAGGGHHAEQLALTIGSRVQVEETQTAHGGDYFIIGEAHELTNSATFFKTTWYLEPAPDSLPWKLGDDTRSRLGQTTRLTY